MRKCLFGVLLCVPALWLTTVAAGQKAAARKGAGQDVAGGDTTTSAGSRQKKASVRISRKKLIGTVLEGTASYYGERFRGKKTHTDEVFDPDKLTAACNKLPLKTWVKVTNLRNHRSVILWINDRMHPKNKRLIDVSARAARELGFYARGLTRVKVEVIPPP
ncbi:MAG TPA: septal ring lytic transglycosylase RlpA family protein [Dinghuibacter sp.]|jgi:rare lipoprotein A|uniref:septal ring lytic transglycosylase RlpA family protein n=1 Tax=Dinghuibacter sp. TaxID=2024697 RepID=UPI002CAAE353|nr:septal ring lytic transglycosylase RlpA family protein [Dinghuibacter sp.]HTJ13807.1 septal ring lytic transglycosylase RlpA family protein [Dinghuibacter sp.]